MCTTDHVLATSPSWVEMIKLVGGFAGIIALTWALVVEFRAYLKIKVKVEKENDFLSVFSEVENERKFKSKKIDNAFLIITPEDMDIEPAGEKIRDELGLNFEIKCTNHLKQLKSTESIYLDDSIAFIPLPYYYDENLWVADERLSYRCSVDSAKFQRGIYSVRFFIFRRGRFHRSIQDLFKI